MEAKLYGQNKGGMSINGIIKDYYAYAGENISAGDLVEYVNGVAGKTDYGESEDTKLSTATRAGYTISAVTLDENRVFIAHSYTSDYYLYGIVVTVNGASIEIGTDTKISSISDSGLEISAVALDKNRVFIAHSAYSSRYLHGVAVTIDGATITYGTDVQLSSSTTYTGDTISAVALDENRVFIAHSYNESNYYLYGIVCTISGTEITYGTDKAIVSSTNAGHTIATQLLDNGNVFIVHSRATSYYLYGIICTISGTTISKGTDTKLSSTHTSFAISTEKLDSGDIFIAHSDGSTSPTLYGVVCIISDTTITAGIDTQLSSADYAGAEISPHLLNNGKILILHNLYNTSYYLYGMMVNVDGTTITVETDTQLSTESYTGRVISSILLNNGTIFTAHNYGSSYYLYAQIFGIDYENNMPTNNVVAIEYETQVRKVTTGQFDGVAKTSGEGGDNTGHKDVVSIYTLE